MTLNLKGTGRFLLHCYAGVELIPVAGPFNSYDELVEAARAFRDSDDFKESYDNVFWASNHDGLNFGVFRGSDLE